MALIAAPSLHLVANDSAPSGIRTPRLPKTGSLASGAGASLWTDALFWQKIS